MQKAPVLLSRGAARLIVVDSIAALFRCDFGPKESIKRSKEISSFGMQLHRLSHKFGVPVVCINQVGHSGFKFSFKIFLLCGQLQPVKSLQAA